MIQEIDKIYVVCEFCGVVNLFTNQICSRCGGILQIKLKINDEIENVQSPKRVLYQKDIEQPHKDFRESQEQVQKQIIETLVEPLKKRKLYGFMPNYKYIIIVVFAGFLIVTIPRNIENINNIFSSTNINSLFALIFAILPVLVMLLMIKKISYTTRRRYY